MALLFYKCYFHILLLVGFQISLLAGNFLMQNYVFFDRNAYHRYIFTTRSDCENRWFWLSYRKIKVERWSWLWTAVRINFMDGESHLDLNSAFSLNCLLQSGDLFFDFIICVYLKDPYPFRTCDPWDVTGCAYFKGNFQHFLVVFKTGHWFSNSALDFVSK